MTTEQFECAVLILGTLFYFLVFGGTWVGSTGAKHLDGWDRAVARFCAALLWPFSYAVMITRWLEKET